MQTLSPQDASFLHLETGDTQMHIGSTLIAEGPPPEHRHVLDAFTAKLQFIPRYRHKVRFVPLDLGRPVWVDDPHFNLGYHVRRTALPEPGGEEQLRNLVGRLMSQPLDRSKPLWEVWVVEGLADGRWAMVTKVHHCMVDGVSGAELLAVLLDVEPEPTLPDPDDWVPELEPSDAELARRAIREQVAVPAEGIRAVRARLRGPRRIAGALLENARAVRDFADLGGIPGGGRPRSLNGPIGPHRRYAWARGSLADIKGIRQAFGGTVNDVILAAITNGFRELLLGRGEEVSGKTVRSMVPVSVRGQEARGIPDNRVSAMWAELPVGIDDPVERLRSITHQLEDLKDSRQALGGKTLTSLGDFASPMLLALGTRVAARAPQRAVNTVTTNVPGPQVPLYCWGQRVVAAYPYVPLGANVRVTVAIFSYDGGIYVGVTGDYDTAADIGILCEGVETGLSDLVAATGRAQAGEEESGATGAANGRAAASPS
jgi:diacylglycerol O-acyltransferase / wax synthase